MKCKYCESENLKTKNVVFKNETKHVELRCADCGRFQKYLGQEKDPRNYVFYFGKFKGKTVGDVLKLEPSYLDWCVKNLNPETNLYKGINQLRTSKRA